MFTLTSYCTASCRGTQVGAAEDTHTPILFLEGYNTCVEQEIKPSRVSSKSRLRVGDAANLDP
eukprot:m.16046 g.16046  ORF g.16046 m.16046 type:complete len:63 (-) comp8894_c0_seq2:11-199(-)